MVSSDVADRELASPPPAPPEFERLEAAVRRLANELAGYQARAQGAEKRALELERALKDLRSGELDPLALRDRVRKLEQDNRELRGRMLRAQDRIRRLLARFDFLREDM
jgi:predicted RNase H-like nuclease (RuvC/YqgF family)